MLNFFFSLKHPSGTPECPQKNSAQSVQPFGRLQGTYKRMSCFIIQIDDNDDNDNDDNDNNGNDDNDNTENDVNKDLIKII